MKRFIVGQSVRGELSVKIVTANDALDAVERARQVIAAKVLWVAGPVEVAHFPHSRADWAIAVEEVAKYKIGPRVKV